jgi:hypothetical protein
MMVENLLRKYRRYVFYLFIYLFLCFSVNRVHFKVSYKRKYIEKFRKHIALRFEIVSAETYYLKRIIYGFWKRFSTYEAYSITHYNAVRIKQVVSFHSHVMVTTR